MIKDCAKKAENAVGLQIVLQVFLTNIDTTVCELA